MKNFAYYIFAHNSSFSETKIEFNSGRFLTILYFDYSNSDIVMVDIVIESLIDDFRDIRTHQRLFVKK
jgi:hypothetical protein